MGEFLLIQGRDALTLAFFLSLPIVATCALLGSLGSYFQNLFQVQDPNTSHLIRLAAGGIVLFTIGGSMAKEISDFAISMFELVNKH